MLYHKRNNISCSRVVILIFAQRFWMSWDFFGNILLYTICTYISVTANKVPTALPLHLTVHHVYTRNLQIKLKMQNILKYSRKSGEVYYIYLHVLRQRRRRTTRNVLLSTKRIKKFIIVDFKVWLYLNLLNKYYRVRRFLHPTFKCEITIYIIKSI